MKTIIAGSRMVRNPEWISQAVEASGFVITEVVSGRQRSKDPVTGELYGVDYLGEQWAKARRIPVAGFPADWARQGKAAGPRRNEIMAGYAQALIAIWDEESTGTRDMIRRAKTHALQVFVWSTVTQNEWKPVTQEALFGGTCSRCGAPLNNVSPGFSATPSGLVCALCLGSGEEIARARSL